MSAQGFPSSDWFILEIFITHVTEVLKLASKMYLLADKIYVADTDTLTHSQYCG